MASHVVHGDTGSIFLCGDQCLELGEVGAGMTVVLCVILDHCVVNVTVRNVPYVGHTVRIAGDARLDNVILEGLLGESVGTGLFWCCCCCG